MHRFLELKTTQLLSQNYRFHALPDACVYLIFDQLNPEIAGCTKLNAQSEEFNLGRQFHFVNIRFLPGVWQSAYEPLAHGLLAHSYQGALPLPDINSRLLACDFNKQQLILTQFVDELLAENIVKFNPTTHEILQHLDTISAVADMAKVTKKSARQLQRILKTTTDLTPHDFLKILRVQQSLNGHDTWSYSEINFTPGLFVSRRRRSLRSLPRHPRHFICRRHRLRLLPRHPRQWAPLTSS